MPVSAQHGPSGYLDLVRRLTLAEDEIEHLQIGMGHRTVIGQAQGMLMERLRIDPGSAFEYLARVSSHENRKLFAVAADIVRTVKTAYSGVTLPGAR